jgi:hypothetical protein
VIVTVTSDRWRRRGFFWAILWVQNWGFHQDFRQDLMRAREIRADFSFGEQILDIADDTSEDCLRSRVRIGVRQLHMSRLQPQTWGERQQIDLKSDWTLLTEDERRRKAEELITMIEEIRNPPPGPPPLVYRWEEAPEEAEPGRIGWQPRSATGRER